MHLWSAYNRAILKYPISIKTLTTVFLISVGDFLCQIIESKTTHPKQLPSPSSSAPSPSPSFPPSQPPSLPPSPPAISPSPSASSIFSSLAPLTSFNGKRNLELLSWGFIAGPVCHYWLNFLERCYPGTAPKNVFKKLALDQSLMSPLTLSVFFMYVGFIQGNSTEDIWKKASQQIAPTLLVSYAVWPLANGVNFSYVPLQYRLLYINFVGLFWNVFLSHMHHRYSPS